MGLVYLPTLTIKNQPTVAIDYRYSSPMDPMGLKVRYYVLQLSCNESRKVFNSWFGNAEVPSHRCIVRSPPETNMTMGKNNHLKMYLLLKIIIFKPAMLAFWKKCEKKGGFLLANPNGCFTSGILWLKFTERKGEIVIGLTWEKGKQSFPSYLYTDHTVDG